MLVVLLFLVFISYFLSMVRIFNVHGISKCSVSGEDSTFNMNPYLRVKQFKQA